MRWKVKKKKKVPTPEVGDTKITREYPIFPFQIGNKKICLEEIFVFWEYIVTDYYDAFTIEDTIVKREWKWTPIKEVTKADYIFQHVGGPKSDYFYSHPIRLPSKPIPPPPPRPKKEEDK